MKAILSSALFGLAAVGLAAAFAATADLKVGDPAPDFTLQASDGSPGSRRRSPRGARSSASHSRSTAI